MAVVDKAGNATDSMRRATRPHIAVTNTCDRKLKAGVSDRSKSNDDTFTITLLHLCNECRYIIRRVSGMRIYPNKDFSTPVCHRGCSVYPASLNSLRIVDQADSPISIGITSHDFASPIRTTAVSDQNFQDPHGLLTYELLEQ
jgi:hypothetical protein